MLTKRRLVVGFLALGLVLSFATPAAQAAQVAQVIADEAVLHEYPQASSRALVRIQKGEQITVSNLPTEGFYKARAKTGEVGWLSGNDIHVAAPTAKGNAPVVARKQRKAAGPASPPEDTRIQFSYGIDSFGYGDMKNVFDTTALSSKGMVLEAAFRLNSSLFWALRAEMHTGETAETDVDTSTTQKLKQSTIPVEIGLQWDVHRSESLRFTLGAFLGMAISSSMTVTWTTSGAIEEVKYSSMDPCANFGVQAAYSLGGAFGLFADLGYHYQKTGEFEATQRFNGKPAFAIDYSGITIRGGLELKF